MRGRRRVSENAFTSVTIPFGLAERIKKRIHGTGFTSLSSYVAFVLREILGQDKPGRPDTKGDPMGRVEKEELLKRLKNLGYI